MKAVRHDSYLRTHPAPGDRVARLAELARNDIEKARRVAVAKAQEATNAPYVATAQRLWEIGDLRRLSSFVAEWLRVLPESAPGWRFKGLLLSASEDTKRLAWGAFANSIEFDPGNKDAWYQLCTSLSAAGYRAETAVCISAMQGMGYTDELRNALFGGRLYLHGRPPAPSTLYWAREESGSRLITNDAAFMRYRGLPAERITPGWLPVR